MDRSMFTFFAVAVLFCVGIVGGAMWMADRAELRERAARSECIDAGMQWVSGSCVR